MRKLLLLLLFFLPLVILAQDFNSYGGEYNLDNNYVCLSSSDRIIITNEIKENLKLLSNNDVISTKNQSVSFIWPLRKDTSLVFNNYFGISNFVDQDSSSLIVDYNLLLKKMSLDQQN